MYGLAKSLVLIRNDVPMSFYFSKRALANNPNCELALESQIFIHAHQGRRDKAKECVEVLWAYSKKHQWAYHLTPPDEYLDQLQKCEFYGYPVKVKS
mmetsp:Transcript_10780/g.16252  ORF Transcript_10780/g.16252 Transcript_10780/m.16252 type:complete len:97 (-) Transcript_10780:24-314(-)